MRALLPSKMAGGSLPFALHDPLPFIPLAMPIKTPQSRVFVPEGKQPGCVRRKRSYNKQQAHQQRDEHKTNMACLRFGTDERGKEILELVPAAEATPSKKRGEPCCASTQPPLRDSSTDDAARQVQSRCWNPGRPDSGVVAEGAGVGAVERKPYKGENTIVMMEWEKPYMRALVDNLGVTGTGKTGGWREKSDACVFDPSIYSVCSTPIHY